MSDMDTEQIELAARQYANKTQAMSNYPHDWQSSYDAYMQGATDALHPKQANDVETNSSGLDLHHVSNRTLDDLKIIGYKCLRCGREFKEKIPHKCDSGYRKRNMRWRPKFE